MIERDYRGDRLNAIVNHPEVLPWVSLPGMGRLDMRPVLASNRRHVALVCDGGGMLFEFISPGKFAVHTQFVPEKRGRHALRHVREMVRWMFEHTDAEVLVTMVPQGNVAADALTRAIGGVLTSEEPDVWNGKPAKFYTMTRQQWIKKCLSPSQQP